ncbi:MAG: hypothetical protein ORN98_11155 [Alphaproteobacteria bacterium]|nr:hypothetical protein [Alphaproteobacteria bacterium]
MRYVIDTNVPIVANSAQKLGQPKPIFSLNCIEQAVDFLSDLHTNKLAVIFLDEAGEILKEYTNNLNTRGQPGVGDRFLASIIHRNSPQKVEYLNILSDNNAYLLPDEILQSNFDKDDRKFAALAIAGDARVVNATDSDWLDHKNLLEKHGIKIKFLCNSD